MSVQSKTTATGHGVNSALRLERVLQTLAGLCQTDAGAAMAAERPAAPTPAEAEALLDLTGEAVLLLRDGHAPLLTPLLNIGQSLLMAARGAPLDGLELLAIRRVAACAESVRRTSKSWPQAVLGLRALAHAPADLGLLAALLSDAIGDDGSVLDSASRELARLRQEVVQLQHRLRRRMEELVKETDDAGHLQDDYFTLRDDRYVLPVKATDKRVIAGIIHGSSQTGQTVYIEPQELVTGNNQLTLAMEAVRREERRILAALSAMCVEHQEDLQGAVQTLAALDGHLAAGRLAERLQANRPTFSPTGQLALRKARHPLLVLDGAKVVASDIVLPDAAQWLLISGPNGGGKTVALSTIGLLAELARRGLFISAAPDSVLPWPDDVLVVLGDAQDIERGLSTFEGHLRAIQRVWDRAIARSHNPMAQTGVVLILVDELASGTEPIAGNALATAWLEGMVANAPHALGVVTTHFESPKLLALRDPHFANAALTLDGATFAPTYRLEVGQVGSSSPLALARRVGLDEAVVSRADALVGGGGSEVAVVLEELAMLRTALQHEQQQVTKAKTDLERSRQLLEDQRRNEQRSVDRRVAQQAEAALGELTALGKELAALRAQLADADKKQLAEAAKVVSEKQVRAEQMQRQAAARLRGEVARQAAQASDVLPGATLWHRSLQRPVQVLEVDDKARRVKVRAGGLDTWTTLVDLERLTAEEAQRSGVRPQASAAPDRKPRRPAETEVPTDAAPQLELGVDSLALRTPDRTVDLRGQRVDEAVNALDVFLDRAVLRHIPGICVVHGMGTGAVRDAVRSHLRSHPHVQRFRPGEKGEGGDGATLVWLREG